MTFSRSCVWIAALRPISWRVELSVDGKNFTQRRNGFGLGEWNDEVTHAESRGFDVGAMRKRIVEVSTLPKQEAFVGHKGADDGPDALVLERGDPGP